MALRFPDQLLRDAREVLRGVRSRVRKLETERKKRGEGRSGRCLMVIFIDSDIMDGTSSTDRNSEQRLQPAAVVDYGEHRAGVGCRTGRGDADGNDLYEHKPDLRTRIHFTASASSIGSVVHCIPYNTQEDTPPGMNCKAGLLDNGESVKAERRAWE